VDEYRPAAQEEQLAAPAEENQPAAHAAHALAPAAPAYEPKAQLEHAEAPPAENRPARHDAHAAWEIKG
jgi:hypothetical protein